MSQTGVQTPASANPFGMALFTVATPSGSDLHLQTQEEADWYERRRDEYRLHNKFINISDILDLDRLLMLEVMTYRWGIWIAQGWDYLHSMVDPRELQKNIREYSQEIRMLKQNMGIDKVGRDKNKGEQLGDYISTLLERAKIFGYHRNRQYEYAVTKVYELRSQIMTHDRCDEREREDLDLSEESILAWIREELIPGWDEIDEKFRVEQSIWIRSQ